MNRANYEAGICERLSQAKIIPFKKVSPIEGWVPEVEKCHDNVDKWVKANGGCIAVRGWVVYGGSRMVTMLTAHSVVKGADGQIFDLTPLKNEQYRGYMRFVRHIGDDQRFFEEKNINIFIDCFCSDAAA